MVVTVVCTLGHFLWPALLSNDSSGGLVGTASVADTLSTHSAAPLLNQTGVTVCHSCSVECCTGCTGREGLWWPDEGRRPSSVTIHQFPFHPDSTTPSSVKHDLLAFIHSQGVVIWGRGRSTGPQRGLAMWVLRVISSDMREGMGWVLWANEVLGPGCRVQDRGYPFLSGCLSSTWR